MIVNRYMGNISGVRGRHVALHAITAADSFGIRTFRQFTAGGLCGMTAGAGGIEFSEVGIPNAYVGIVAIDASEI